MNTLTPDRRKWLEQFIYDDLVRAGFDKADLPSSIPAMADHHEWTAEDESRYQQNKLPPFAVPGNGEDLIGLPEYEKLAEQSEPTIGSEGYNAYRINEIKQEIAELKKESQNPAYNKLLGARISFGETINQLEYEVQELQKEEKLKVERLYPLEIKTPEEAELALAGLLLTREATEEEMKDLYDAVDDINNDRNQWDDLTPPPGKALKYDSAKPNLAIVPVEALEFMSVALVYGANKYGRNNYKLGHRWSQCVNAALRHLYAMAGGEEIDKESGNTHLSHALASLGMLAFHVKHHPELNDLFITGDNDE
jgi:hypothetical protein